MKGIEKQMKSRQETGGSPSHSLLKPRAHVVDVLRLLAALGSSLPAAA
jgi:hypothetical protein